MYIDDRIRSFITIKTIHFAGLSAQFDMLKLFKCMRTYLHTLFELPENRDIYRLYRCYRQLQKY